MVFEMGRGVKNRVFKAAFVDQLVDRLKSVEINRFYQRDDLVLREDLVLTPMDGLPTI